MDIKRLIRLLPGSMRKVWLNVFFQWLGLLANIALVFALGAFLGNLFLDQTHNTAMLLGVAVAAFLVRCFSISASSRVAHAAAEDVKQALRAALFDKVLRLGPSYGKHVSTSQLVQLSAEGVEQLQTFFAGFLPQLLYSLLAPLTLFVVLSFYSLKVALLLLICVPLIPLVIAGIHKRVKQVIGKYWGSYAELGHMFLENLQGMTTLKIYQADASRNQLMNDKAEDFRKMTMRLLAVQLNSIIVMDVIAFGGAALGIALTVYELHQGNIGLVGALILLLLAAEYFVPLRLLGSFFHIAMNGMAASGRIFRILDIAEADPDSKRPLPDGPLDVHLANLRFAYGDDKVALQDISLTVPARGLVSIVGRSGCGKSTLAQLIAGAQPLYDGSLRIGGIEGRDIRDDSRMRAVALLSHSPYFFKGTVRDNLQMARPGATDQDMRNALEQTRLLAFLDTQQGLDTPLQENATNLSGGQRQRLSLARGLLHDAAILILDEATSNIDADNEAEILALIHTLAQRKAVILISHRLANVTGSDCIHYMDGGSLQASGTHEQLMRDHTPYRQLFDYQQGLEHYGQA